MPDLPSVELNPTRLSIFALNRSTGAPVTRLPVYAEVIWTAVESLPPPPPPDDRFDDFIIRALFLADKRCDDSPTCRRRVLETIRAALASVLTQGARDALRDDTEQAVDALAEIVRRVLEATGSETLDTIQTGRLEVEIEKAVRAMAERRELAVNQPPPDPLRTVATHPLGILATDHVGYLSFDLTRLPRPVLDAVKQTMRAIRGVGPALDPVEPTASIWVYPFGQPGLRFDALKQLRFTHDAVVMRVMVDVPAMPHEVRNLGLLAMQNPGLTDWRLSPGSFATNPGMLVGEDGCESILPASVALQEFYLYQVVRLTDVAPPVAAVTPGQVQLGVINEYRVAWHPLGHSLGQVLYSLPLAPGESVNLAVIDWTRRDEAQRKERTTVDEQLIHNERRDRVISETVDAAVREYQHGSSFMGGVSGAVGGSSGTASGGIAGSLGGSTSNSSGTRSVAATTVQKVSDNITQVSSASRELQSTVVVQSTQTEKETIETRTVANYNHSHALTILYYEVLRHFRVSTELVRRRPAVLVKIKTDWFAGNDAGAEKSARDHRKALESALRDPKVAAGFDVLDRIEHGRQVTDAIKILGPPAPATPQPPPSPGDREFIYFKFEMTAGGLVAEGSERVRILGHLFGASGTKQLWNVAINPNPEILNPNGAFVTEGATNTFYVGLKPPDVTIKWRNINAVQIVISLRNVNDVAFTHIRITARDTDGNDQELVDQPYETGPLIIKEGPADEGTAILLPTRRPPPPPPPVPSGRPAEEVEDEVNRARLLAHLRDHAAHFSRAIYFGREGLERAAELDAIKLADGSNVLQKVENRPIEVIGDYVAFPSTDRAWEDKVAASLDEFGPDDMVLDERLIALPTRGVFAEAQLGHCNSSELIDNTRFWDWQQSPVPHLAPEIAPIQGVTPQPQQPNLQPTSFPQSLVNIVNPPAAPDPTGLAAAMSVLATPNLFRDMSGQAEVADLLKRLSDNSISIAEASNVARGIQARSAAGGGGSGSRGGGSAAKVSGGGGGAPGIGGPRAAPTQPSMANRDLQDLQNVLGQARQAGYTTPEDAQQIFTKAAHAAYTPESVGGGVPFRIEPDSFDFKPVGPNRQQTSCVPIEFGYGFGLLPPMRFRVGVIVEAPLELRDGKKLSVREAQFDSANAATAAAFAIKALLDSYAIGPSEVQPRFVVLMQGSIQSTGLGYRVIGCFPRQPKVGTTDEIDV